MAVDATGYDTVILDDGVRLARQVDVLKDIAVVRMLLVVERVKSGQKQVDVLLANELKFDVMRSWVSVEAISLFD